MPQPLIYPGSPTYINIQYIKLQYYTIKHTRHPKITQNVKEFFPLCSSTVENAIYLDSINMYLVIWVCVCACMRACDCIIWDNLKRNYNWRQRELYLLMRINCLKPLSYVLIHPCLSYQTLAWRSANSSTLNKTEILQKRAIRTISRAYYNSHTELLFKKPCILKLNDLYESQVALFMYDYMFHKFPLSFNGTYKCNYEIQEGYQTR